MRIFSSAWSFLTPPKPKLMHPGHFSEMGIFAPMHAYLMNKYLSDERSDKGLEDFEYRVDHFIVCLVFLVTNQCSPQPFHFFGGLFSKCYMNLFTTFSEQNPDAEAIKTYFFEVAKKSHAATDVKEKEFYGLFLNKIVSLCKEYDKTLVTTIARILRAGTIEMAERSSTKNQNLVTF